MRAAALILGLAAAASACTSGTEATDPVPQPSPSTAATTTQATAATTAASSTTIAMTTTSSRSTSTTAVAVSTATTTTTAAPVATSPSGPPPPPVPVATPSLGSTVATQVTTVAAIDAGTGGIAVMADGTILNADIGISPTFRGRALYRILPSGEVDVYASDGEMVGATGIAIAPEGIVYQSAFRSRQVVEIDPSGEVSVYASTGIAGPVGLVLDGSGALFVSDCGGNRIVRIAPDRTTATFAEDFRFSCPNGLTMDDRGWLYVANFGDGRLLSVDPQGSVEVVAELPGGGLAHVVYGGNDVLYATAAGDNRVYTVTRGGEVTPLAGSGVAGTADGPALEAEIASPNGIAIGPDGALYINASSGAIQNSNYPTVVRRIELAP